MLTISGQVRTAPGEEPDATGCRTATCKPHQRDSQLGAGRRPVAPSNARAGAFAPQRARATNQGSAQTLAVKHWPAPALSKPAPSHQPTQPRLTHQAPTLRVPLQGRPLTTRAVLHSSPQDTILGCLKVLHLANWAPAPGGGSVGRAAPPVQANHHKAVSAPPDQDGWAQSRVTLGSLPTPARQAVLLGSSTWSGPCSPEARPRSSLAQNP